MGTYTPDGRIFIDKIAWEDMGLNERNAIERHEKRELRLRLDGVPYETAHRRAMREERGYTPSLESKLRGHLSRFGERKHIVPPPKDVMGGFLPSVEFSRSYKIRNIGLDGRAPEDRPTLPIGYSYHVLTKGKDCTSKKKTCGRSYFFGDTVFRSPTGNFYCPNCGGVLK